MSQQQLFDNPTDDLFAEVVISRPARALDRPFTYSVPKRLRDRVGVGSYVFVPFGRERLAGYVIGLTDRAPEFKTRAIISLLADDPLFDEELLELAQWVADRYQAPLLDALRCIFPPGANRKPVVRVQLTARGAGPAALQELGSKSRQAQILRLMQEAGGDVTREELYRSAHPQGLNVAAVNSSLAGLEQKGLAALHHELRPPSVQELVRQVVELEDQEAPWDEVIAGLSARAPRQAEALERLVEAGDEPVPMSELPREAVRALQKKGLVRVIGQRQERAPDEGGMGDESPTDLKLTAAQQAILSRVCVALDTGQYAGLLIRGVTSSGKTEVYLQAIQQTLARGRSAIVLVPEISLTPQMVGRFRARFGGSLALLHSALGPGERFDEWGRIARGEALIVVGARSALFAPVHNLGIIVIDEEHERAYKQDSSPRYHAVGVAEQRAKQAGAVLLMGSATPSLESYYRATNPDDPALELMELTERIDDRPLPEVVTIDLRKETLLGQGQTFSQRIHDEIGERLARGEQVILFLNRRGFSTFVMCRECGWSLRCPNCAVSLIYHHDTRTVRCHHCDYTQPVPTQCPSCRGVDLSFHGMGTERIADQVEREFENASVARMDRDTVSHKGAYGQILRRFARGEANVLVGTQMIAKGLHFPAVTLVAVLNADVGLNRPDFRATEQTFQILTQVAGRAGRDDKPGIALVQTYNPKHVAIARAAEHDYLGFYTAELAERRENFYPPFAKLANLVFTAEDEETALQQARRCATICEELGIGPRHGDVQYAGPAQCPLHRLRGKFRYQLLLKAADTQRLRKALNQVEKLLGDTGDTSIIIDIEPYDMM